MFEEFVALVDEFDSLVGSRDVIAETDYEGMPADIKESIVEMLKTLSEKGPTWAPEQFLEAKNRGKCSKNNVLRSVPSAPPQ